MTALPMRQAHATPRVEDIIREFSVVPTSALSKGVRRLTQAHRAQYDLPPPTEADYAQATRWKATVYQGRVIAVFGERDYGDRVLGVTDCYGEPTRYGRMAVYGMGKWWQSLVDTGVKDEVAFIIPSVVEGAWKAVIQETKQPPAALIFRYRGKTHGL
jgi:hypothetical protein